MTVRPEVKEVIQEYARRLGMSETDVVALAVRLMQLVEKTSLDGLKLYIEPDLIKFLYENSIEFRRVLKHVYSEIGYVV